MKRIIIPICFFLSITSMNAQNNHDSWQDKVLKKIETANDENENIDVQQLIDDLQYFIDHPLNINTTVASDLAQLQLLNPIQIQSLLAYRAKFGQIFSPFELKAIEGFDLEISSIIQQFIYFGENAVVPYKYRPHQEILIRTNQLLEKQAGFRKPKKYEGSAIKLYSRYRFSGNNVQAGITAEKDAGESIFTKSNANGFDYYSGFASFSFSKNKNQVFLGDYRLQFGQGLAAWQGFSLGKSAEVTQTAKFNQGIRPHTSTDENFFMRGIAACIQLEKFRIFPFLSIKKFDANIDSKNGETLFTSFQTSGLHLTQSEIEDKNSVQEKTIGTYLSFTDNQFSLGLSVLNIQYNHPLKRKEADYNKFLFEGKELSNIAIDYQWGLNRCFLFGEVAGCSTKGIAFLNGVLAKPLDQVEMSFIVRNIEKKYNAPLGMAFSEGSKLNDEQGIYLGMKVFLAPKVDLNFYADFFRNRWIKYTTAGPANGSEYHAQVNYQISNRWTIYGRYFFEIKPLKANGDFSKINLDQKREKLRFHLSGDLSETFFLRSRIEFSSYSHDHNAFGWMAFQDVGIQFSKLPSKWWFRIAYFNTDDYDSRIYTYENDLLYQFSIPAFYGEGIRSYLNGKVKICEKTDLWIKASRTWFFGVDGIGSGNSEIVGNTKTEFKLQLRFRF